VRRYLVVGALVASAAALSVALALPRGGQRLALPAAGKPDPATIAQAIAISKRLGAVPAGRTLHLVLSLPVPNRKAANAAFESGGGKTGRYGPDPKLAQRALATLRRAGLPARWTPGDGIVEVDAPALAVERFFHVRLTDYRLPTGRRFYAPSRQPAVPASLRHEIVSAVGFDDYYRATTAAIRPGGVVPKDVLSFYDIDGLRQQGLDGAGVTVVFPEFMSPGQISQLNRDVASFSSKNGLPAASVTYVHRSQWKPLPPSDSFAKSAVVEAALDLEVVHGIAPAARLVVYMAAPQDSTYLSMLNAMVRENPKAIISNSTGLCEARIPRRFLSVFEAPFRAQAAENATQYVASGDSGAYTCGFDYAPAIDYASALPPVTSVGGTSVFLSQNGGYFRELAWGNPLGRDGGGGGFSKYYGRPPFQSGIKLPGRTRVVPDVAGLADTNTGWSITVYGQELQVGGTSAAAPLWAGMTALIDQALVKEGLKQVGVANAALYWIAERNAQFHAFHDITGGDNLLYKARPGYDAATGWGSPDAIGLLKGFEAYQRRGT
jgi:kumamolisin